MIPISRRMDDIHSDIRGPLYFKALEMSEKGIPVLRLNTGNPASFGFEMPDIFPAKKNCASKICAFDAVHIKDIDFADAQQRKVFDQLISQRTGADNHN